MMTTNPPCRNETKPEKIDGLNEQTLTLSSSSSSSQNVATSDIEHSVDICEKHILASAFQLRREMIQELKQKHRESVQRMRNAFRIIPSATWILSKPLTRIGDDDTPSRHEIQTWSGDFPLVSDMQHVEDSMFCLLNVPLEERYDASDYFDVDDIFIDEANEVFHDCELVGDVGGVVLELTRKNEKEDMQVPINTTEESNLQQKQEVAMLLLHQDVYRENSEDTSAFVDVDVAIGDGTNERFYDCFPIMKGESLVQEPIADVIQGPTRYGATTEQDLINVFHTNGSEESRLKLHQQLFLPFEEERAAFLRYQDISHEPPLPSNSEDDNEQQKLGQYSSESLSSVNALTKPLDSNEPCLTSIFDSQQQTIEQFASECTSSDSVPRRSQDLKEEPIPPTTECFLDKNNPKISCSNDFDVMLLADSASVGLSSSTELAIETKQELTRETLDARQDLPEELDVVSSSENDRDIHNILDRLYDEFIAMDNLKDNDSSSICQQSIDEATNDFCKYQDGECVDGAGAGTELLRTRICAEDRQIVSGQASSGIVPTGSENQETVEEALDDVIELMDSMGRQLDAHGDIVAQRPQVDEGRDTESFSIVNITRSKNTSSHLLLQSSSSSASSTDDDAKRSSKQASTSVTHSFSERVSFCTPESDCFYDVSSEEDEIQFPHLGSSSTCHTRLMSPGRASQIHLNYGPIDNILGGSLETTNESSENGDQRKTVSGVWDGVSSHDVQEGAENVPVKMTLANDVSCLIGGSTETTKNDHKLTMKSTACQHSEDNPSILPWSSSLCVMPSVKFATVEAETLLGIRRENVPQRMDFLSERIESSTYIHVDNDVTREDKAGPFMTPHESSRITSTNLSTHSSSRKIPQIQSSLESQRPQDPVAMYVDSPDHKQDLVHASGSRGSESKFEKSKESCVCTEQPVNVVEPVKTSDTDGQRCEVTKGTQHLARPTYSPTVARWVPSNLENSTVEESSRNSIPSFDQNSLSTMSASPVSPRILEKNGFDKCDHSNLGMPTLDVGDNLEMSLSGVALVSQEKKHLKQMPVDERLIPTTSQPVKKANANECGPTVPFSNINQRLDHNKNHNHVPRTPHVVPTSRSPFRGECFSACRSLLSSGDKSTLQSLRAYYSLASPPRTEASASIMSRTPRDTAHPVMSPAMAATPKSPYHQPITICSNKFSYNLHSKMGPCDRCWALASPSEQDEYEKRGSQLRIFRTRGGCACSCAIFPSNNKNNPVRLCRQCFFATHQQDRSRVKVYRGNHVKVKLTT
jgi:hypothetical protein